MKPSIRHIHLPESASTDTRLRPYEIRAQGGMFADRIRQILNRLKRRSAWSLTCYELFDGIRV